MSFFRLNSLENVNERKEIIIDCSKINNKLSPNFFTYPTQESLDEKEKNLNVISSFGIKARSNIDYSNDYENLLVDKKGNKTLNVFPKISLINNYKNDLFQFDINFNNLSNKVYLNVLKNISYSITSNPCNIIQNFWFFYIDGDHIYYNDKNSEFIIEKIIMRTQINTSQFKNFEFNCSNYEKINNFSITNRALGINSINDLSTIRFSFNLVLRPTDDDYKESKILLINDMNNIVINDPNHVNSFYNYDSFKEAKINSSYKYRYDFTKNKNDYYFCYKNKSSNLLKNNNEEEYKKNKNIIDLLDNNEFPIGNIFIKIEHPKLGDINQPVFQFNLLKNSSILFNSQIDFGLFPCSDERKRIKYFNSKIEFKQLTNKILNSLEPQHLFKLIEINELKNENIIYPIKNNIEIASVLNSLPLDNDNFASFNLLIEEDQYFNNKNIVINDSTYYNLATKKTIKTNQGPIKRGFILPFEYKGNINFSLTLKINKHYFKISWDEYINNPYLNINNEGKIKLFIDIDQNNMKNVEYLKIPKINEIIDEPSLLLNPKYFLNSKNKKQNLNERE